MTLRERHLAIFRYEPIDCVLWQPRLEHWIAVNRQAGTLPPHYKNLGHLEIYDDLHCSPRSYFLFNPCLKSEQLGDVEIQSEELPSERRTTIRTPVGTVTQCEYITPLAHQIREFPLKRVEEIPVIEYLVRHTRWSWDQDLYEQKQALLGERGAPTIYVPRIAIQRLIIQYTGLEGFHYLFHDYPAEMESLIETINETDNQLYEVVCACPVEIINFGDNVASEFISPMMFERFYLPIYQQRSAQLHAAGKKCHAHWDGSCRMLLPYLQETGLDGYEALTPLPQGDVSLEEIRAALGEKQILIDGIPCTYFLPQHSYEELADFTKQIIDLFAPHLVLGISDELSPPGDIEKVRFISELVENYGFG